MQRVDEGREAVDQGGFYRAEHEDARDLRDAIERVVAEARVLIPHADREEPEDEEERRAGELPSVVRQDVVAHERDADERPCGNEQRGGVDDLCTRPASRRRRRFRPWLHAADDNTATQLVGGRAAGGATRFTSPIASASSPTESAYLKAGL